MSNDLQTRDKQNQEVDSSEQYAINMIGDRVLQSADYVVKESKRALEKAMGKRTIAPNSSDSRVSTSKRAYQPVSAQQNAQRQEEYVPEYVSPTQSKENVHTWVKPAAQYEEEKQEPVVHADTVHDRAPLPSQGQGGNIVKRNASRPERAKPFSTAKKATKTEPEYTPHMRTTDDTLRLSEEHSINTWQNSRVTNSLQNQGAALHTAETSGATVQTFQAAGQTAGNAGASAAANAAAPGVGAAIQATEKAVTKIKETVESIAASAPKSKSSWGALAALFLLPMLIIAAIAGAFRGGGSAKNVGLSADVIALMPQISAACQAHGIPEYAPLVAAVIMQESGGRVDDVGGDVMQCAEGMGLPVGTPVSVEESINFGTGIIARNLREAGAAGTVRYVQYGWTPAHGVDGMWSFGNSVFIEHGDGWISAYGHLSGLAVASGETVAQGQLIGYIGSTGNSTGPHLHLALYHNGDAGIGGKNFAELAWPQFNTI